MAELAPPLRERNRDLSEFAIGIPAEMIRLSGADPGLLAQDTLFSS